MTRDVEKTTPFVKDDKQPTRGGQGSQGKKSGEKSSQDQPAKAVHAAGHMFSNFEAAKNWKRPKWAAPLLTGVLLLHVAIFMTMWAKTIWDIDQLDRPKNSVDLAIATPPPPPPAPPKGAVKPQDVKITPKKVRVKDIVQPVKIEKQEVVAPIVTGDSNGVEEGGDANGVPNGDIGSVVAAPPPPPPPPPPPRNVAPQVLDANRIAGEKEISPDEVTKTEIKRSGQDRVMGSFKICITAEGNIKDVRQMKSTGFAAYDAKILAGMREWRYRPFTVDGKPQPACTAVSFIYKQI